MFKRRTSRIRRRPNQVLNARVMSPRIAWYGFLRTCGKLMKVTLALALIAAAGWGIWLGVRRGLIENKEFKLQAVRLTPNTALDVPRLVEVTGIDLGGSLFQCDLSQIEDRVGALPEISSVRARREFPGTLIVEVTAREPYLWVASESRGIPPRDFDRGLVVDREGHAYPCPAGQRRMALSLPVVMLGEGGQELAAGRKVVHPEFDRMVRLYQEACKVANDAPLWIDTLRQTRTWELELASRDGMKAQFGLGDHARQMGDLMAALEHSRQTGQPIATINLIPKRNLPVSLRDGSAPRAVLIDEPDATPAGSTDRRDRDLRNLISR